MKEEFTQGTLISDVRSNRYCNIRCKGVVISARCDLAQDKINSFHYLPALEFEDWIYEELYFRIIKEKRRNIEGIIKQTAQENELDYDVLREGGYDRMRDVFNKCLSTKKQKDDIIRKMEEMIELDKYDSVNDKKIKKEFLKQKSNVKLFKSKIRDVILGNYPKFLFVPRESYLENQILYDGLIIDLQDIFQLDIRTADLIAQNKMDAKLITSQAERQKYNRFFFFESEDDFVIIEAQIKSPWIEYIMQHFAYEFVRIGVDNATQTQIDKMCADFLEK